MLFHSYLLKEQPKPWQLVCFYRVTYLFFSVTSLAVPNVFPQRKKCDILEPIQMTNKMLFLNISGVKTRLAFVKKKCRKLISISLLHKCNENTQTKLLLRKGICCAVIITPETPVITKCSHFAVSVGLLTSFNFLALWHNPYVLWYICSCHHPECSVYLKWDCSLWLCRQWSPKHHTSTLILPCEPWNSEFKVSELTQGRHCSMLEWLSAPSNEKESWASRSRI